MEKYKIDFLNCVIYHLHIYNIYGDVCLFIACQFALESDFGRSKLARNTNNICGMRRPLLRLTLNCEDASKWSVYDSYASCVSDYVLWLCWNRFTQKELKDLYLFKDHLRCSVYCPEKSYLDRINSIYVQFQNHLKNGN